MKVAVLSITAAGVGLTLTAASIVVFCEMHWTPAIMVQAEDRAHRIGQTKPVNCYYLYAKGTLDPNIYHKLQSKFRTVTNILDGHAIKLHGDESKNLANIAEVKRNIAQNSKPNGGNPHLDESIEESEEEKEDFDGRNV